MTSPASSNPTSTTRLSFNPSRIRSSLVMRTADPRFRTWRREPARYRDPPGARFLQGQWPHLHLVVLGPDVHTLLVTSNSTRSTVHGSRGPGDAGTGRVTHAAMIRAAIGVVMLRARRLQGCAYVRAVGLPNRICGDLRASGEGCGLVGPRPRAHGQPVDGKLPPSTRLPTGSQAGRGPTGSTAPTPGPDFGVEQKRREVGMCGERVLYGKTSIGSQAAQSHPE